MKENRFKSETLQTWLLRKKQLGLTNKQISEKTKLPLSTVEQVMCGKVKNPRLDTVQAIERALGISDGWTKEERAAGVVDKMSVPISADEDEIITLLREVEETKGAAARELTQRVIVSIIEETLK